MGRPNVYPLTGEQRVLLSFELTEAMLRNLAAGIRRLCPEADERDVKRLVCNTIDMQRQLENLTGMRHRWTFDPIDGSMRLSVER